MRHHHAGLILDIILAGEGLENGLGKDGIGNAATIGSLTEVIHEPLPRGNGFEVGRLLTGNEPLRDR